MNGNTKYYANRRFFHPVDGERVRIRQWDDMVDEFGTRQWEDPAEGIREDIPCACIFLDSMKYLCGRILTVKHAAINDDIISFVDGLSISVDMVEYFDDDDEETLDTDDTLVKFLDSYEIS